MKKPEDPPREWERLARLLRQALRVNKVDRRLSRPGPGAQDEIITTNRFILILRGELTYTIEGNRHPMVAGTQFLVPAWVRRVWTVPQRSPCEIIWCEFDDVQGAEAGACFHRELPSGELRREKRAYQELHKLFHSGREGSPLSLEGQLKGMLARFWMEALPLVFPQWTGAGTGRLHPEIKAGLRWLQEHFREPGVLERLYASCGLTPNYFRHRFREGMQCSPQEYVQRLRLRYARYLLRETPWQQKRIAAEVGYGDPLYFSRLYHRFWGYPPTEEREKEAGRHRAGFVRR